MPKAVPFPNDTARTSTDDRTLPTDAEISRKRKITAVNENNKKIKKRWLGTPEERQKELSVDEECDEYAAREGLKNTLHGDIYQLKLLMLFVERGVEQDYFWRLATEMDKAQKFDDLVFQYKIESVMGSKNKYRFLQAKSKQDESEKICAKDLLTENEKAPFSLQKYFISYRKMKIDPEWQRGKLKDFIICTNIDFDSMDNLSREGIDLEEDQGPDDFLDFEATENKVPKRYKFKKGLTPKLYEILRRTADVYKLAKLLVEHVYELKKIMLNNDLFKLYQFALAREVLNVRQRRFRRNFINDEKLSPEGTNFRKIFYEEAEKRYTKGRKKLKTKSKDKRKLERVIWEELRTKRFDISSNFGQCPSSQISEFPTDGVKDKDIRNFCKKLIFAVNQPDEKDLGDIISREIGDMRELNLQDTDLVGACFQKEILDWFKDKGKVPGQEGIWYRKKDADNFLDSLVNKVNALIFVGSSLAYRAKLDGYGIKFKDKIKELTEFLMCNSEQKHAVLNLIATKETLLTAIRVHRTIQKMQKIDRYKQNDSLMFLHGSLLLRPEIQKRVISSFSSKNSHHLLVIDCKLTKIEPLKNFCCRLRDIMKVRKEKKLILITLKDESSVVGLEILFKNSKKIYDDVSFKDLNKKSQMKLISKKMINFYGQKRSTSLVELLGIHDYDESVTTELEKYENSIDASMLVKFIRDEDIEVGQFIGNDLREFEKTKKYYISRRINRVIIKHTVLKKNLRSDLVAISAADDGLGVSLNNDMSKVIRFDDTLPNTPHLKGLIILDHKREAEQFGMLSEDLGKNVHLLKIVGEKLIWQQTEGKVTALVKHRDISGSGSSSDDDINKRSVSTLPERKLVDQIDERAAFTLLEKEQVDYIEKQKVFIISDEPGMGKSTVFTYLAQMMKEKKPGQWVIRIDLNDFTDELTYRQESQRADGSYTDDVVDFFVEKLSKLSDNFEKMVLKIAILKNRGEVTLLFDGFDEISPGFTNTVIDLLQKLKKIDVVKILISTRPQMRKKLQTKFGTFPHTLEPFTKEDQIDFLVKFWKANLNPNEDKEQIEQQLRRFARVITNRMAKSINDWVEKLASIPLMIRMIAEIFSYNEERNVETERRMEIVHLYKLFVEKKYYIYGKEKKKEILTNLRVRDDAKILHDKFSKNHEKLALYTLFDKKVLPQRLYIPETEDTKIKEYLDNILKEVNSIGIINEVTIGKAQFIHRTFAEYFVATFINNTLLNVAGHDQVARKFILEQILLDRNYQYEVIRVFLDGLLPEEPTWSDVSVREAWKADLAACRHSKGDIMIHKAAEDGHFKIVRLLLNLFDQHDPERKNWINFKNNQSHRRLLHIAADTERWDVLKWLIEKEGVDVNSMTKFSGTPLHAAARLGNLELVQWLVNNGAHVDAQNYFKKTPLESAAEYGHVQVVKCLLKSEVTNVQDKSSREARILRIAAQRKHWDLVKWLVDIQKVNVHDPPGNKQPLLKNAIQDNNLNIMKWLLNDKGINVNSKLATAESVLVYAVQKSNFEIVEWLIDSARADIKTAKSEGSTLYHWAVECGRYRVLKWLLNRFKADVNVTDDNKRTLLHIAATHRRTEIIQLLVKIYNVQVDDKDNFGCTAWDYYCKLPADVQDHEILKLLGNSSNVASGSRDVHLDDPPFGVPTNSLSL